MGQWSRTTGRQEGIAVEHGHHSGMWVPEEPPTWGRMFLPHLDGWSVLAVLSIVGLVGYLAAVVRLRRSGVAWPWWRTAAWTGGTVSLFAVTGTWFNGYSMVVFSVHMTQHMVLSLITPLLLLLAAPVTLALRTLPRGRGAAGAPRALLLDALHSRVARFLASPLFTVPLFIASLYGVYFTPLFDALMSNPAGHQFMLAHFVVTGLLFFGPIVAQDPWPRTMSHPGRMLELFLPVPFHAFFGVAIMMAGSLVVDTFADPPAGWGIDPLRDQGVAGGIVWAFGELPTVLVLAVVFFSWARSDDRQARTIDRAADRDGGVELEAYNARLRAMAQQQR
ncbi:cytochrome c oxidase assembly protein [Blastococcus sp. VKM Ac-2987]|uniref:cytochrome c oxidase assembly protein n=1 Tax=Blastococcus sp. VKM Ac-2987 TaxID=3004141 RepID=UPI0022ABA2D4|nr:cytochrome c oxidase assembly protein [Blastococcus sp. VKM Ac-2987]MCZ2857695.1 cytochrome c oxidase assembly protein [Blastococcus sp. VKM Ac-2987]